MHVNSCFLRLDIITVCAMCLPVSVFVGHTDVLSVFLLKSLEGCISSVSCNQTELINGFL